MPLEPSAAAQPRGEEFEQLIHELSAEFHRLQQRIGDLARENSELRTAASAGFPDGRPAAGGKAAGKGAANDARSLKTTLACVEGDKGKGQLMPLVTNDEVLSENNKTGIDIAPKSSAWRRSTPHLKVQEKPGPRKSENMGTQSMGTQSVSTSRHSASSNGSGVTTQRKSFMSLNGSHFSRLKAKFEYIDTNDTGKLHLNDLVRIMEMANEPFAYDSLVDLIRVFNGMEPLLGAKDEPLGVDGLGIDLMDFMKINDEQVPLDQTLPDLKSCIFSLRRACTKIPEQMTEEDEEEGAAVDANGSIKKNEERMTKSTAQDTIAWLLETVPAGVILLNTVMAGISADYPEHEGVWEIFEYIFVAFYFGEFAVKVKLYGCREYFRGSDCMWNLFDFVCLALSLVDLATKIAIALFSPNAEQSDNAIFMMIKIFRLSRLARLLRTLRFKIFAELKMMVMGVMSGLRVLTWAIALLVMLIYVVGVGMTNLIGQYELEFVSVRASMFTLFRCWTEGCAAYDGTPLAERLRLQYGPVYMIFHILMTMFVTVGLFNLIMAIFIDNVVTNQLVRKHAEMVDRSPEIEWRLKSLFVQFINFGGLQNQTDEPEKQGIGRLMSRRGQAEPIVANIDKEWEKMREMDVSITKDVFMAWLEDRGFQQLLDDAEIDTANRAELFDVLDADMGGQLCMDELITGLMKLRGSVTKSDIVAIRLKVRYLTSILENKVLDEGSG